MELYQHFNLHQIQSYHETETDFREYPPGIGAFISKEDVLKILQWDQTGTLSGVILHRKSISERVKLTVAKTELIQHTAMHSSPEYTTMKVYKWAKFGFKWTKDLPENIHNNHRILAPNETHFGVHSLIYSEKDHELTVNAQGEGRCGSAKFIWDNRRGTLIYKHGNSYEKYPPISDIIISSPDLARMELWRKGEVVKNVEVIANGHSYSMDFIPIDESLPMIALKGMPSVPEQRQVQEAEIMWLETRTTTPTAAFFDEWKRQGPEEKQVDYDESEKGPDSRYLQWLEARDILDPPDEWICPIQWNITEEENEVYILEEVADDYHQIWNDHLRNSQDMDFLMSSLIHLQETMMDDLRNGNMITQEQEIKLIELSQDVQQISAWTMEEIEKLVQLIIQIVGPLETRVSHTLTHIQDIAKSAIGRYIQYKVQQQNARNMDSPEEQTSVRKTRHRKSPEQATLMDHVIAAKELESQQRWRHREPVQQVDNRRSTTGNNQRTRASRPSLQDWNVQGWTSTNRYQNSGGLTGLDYRNTPLNTLMLVEADQHDSDHIDSGTEEDESSGDIVENSLEQRMNTLKKQLQEIQQLVQELRIKTEVYEYLVQRIYEIGGEQSQMDNDAQTEYPEQEIQESDEGNNSGSKEAIQQWLRRSQPGYEPANNSDEEMDTRSDYQYPEYGNDQHNISANPEASKNDRSSDDDAPDPGLMQYDPNNRLNDTGQSHRMRKFLRKAWRHKSATERSRQKKRRKPSYRMMMKARSKLPTYSHMIKVENGNSSPEEFYDCLELPLGPGSEFSLVNQQVESKDSETTDISEAVAVSRQWEKNQEGQKTPEELSITDVTTRASLESTNRANLVVESLLLAFKELVQYLQDSTEGKTIDSDKEYDGLHARKQGVTCDSHLELRHPHSSVELTSQKLSNYSKGTTSEDQIKAHRSQIISNPKLEMDKRVQHSSRNHGTDCKTQKEPRNESRLPVQQSEAGKIMLNKENEVQNFDHSNCDTWSHMAQNIGCAAMNENKKTEKWSAIKLGSSAASYVSDPSQVSTAGQKN